MAGKSNCHTNRRLSNTELTSVGDGPSIVKPQTIQIEQPNTNTQSKQVQKHPTKVNTNNAVPVTKEIEHLTNTSCNCPPQQSFGTIIETYIPFPSAQVANDAIRALSHQLRRLSSLNQRRRMPVRCERNSDCPSHSPVCDAYECGGE
jgi:hypothetical protein